MDTTRKLTTIKVIKSVFWNPRNFEVSDTILHKVIKNKLAGFAFPVYLSCPKRQIMDSEHKIALASIGA